MTKNYSYQNLQKVSFSGEDLRDAAFAGSDLRGADFTGADLTGADLSHIKTGITPGNRALIFIVALVVSLASGYIAMLAGQTIQIMVASNDPNVRMAGFVSLGIIILFIAFSLWKGVGNAFYKLIIPACILALIIGIVAYTTGAGTGRGALLLILSLMLVVIMFIVGTIARAAAGTLSSTILFVLVAIGGGMFGKSVGGGIGTVLMAISCAIISKKALAGAKGFESLQKFASFITSKFGTSFRNTRLAEANFSQSRISNSDFSNADISLVNWGDSRKSNCLINERITTEKKRSQQQKT